MSNTLHRLRGLAVPLGLVVCVVAAGVAYRKALIAWFSGPASEASAVAATASAPPPPPAKAAEPALAEYHFKAGALASLRTVYAAYEQVRALLAKDKTDGIAPRAHRIDAALVAAGSAVEGAPDDVKHAIDDGAAAAKRLGAATDVAAARHEFSELSRVLVALAGSDARLLEGEHVFLCPMAPGYQKWLQPSATLDNPYMGTKMPTCGNPSAPPRASDSAKPSAGAAPASSGDVAYWTCPMHPSVHEAGPGACPICGMTLTPVSRQDVEQGIITVDATRRQLIGVRTELVAKRHFTHSIRTVGMIAYDETGLADVSLKFKGWVGKLVADSVGKRVRKGSLLFTIYSPEVYEAEQELLTAQNNRALLPDAGLPGNENFLVDAVKQRLRLWDVPSSVVRRVLEKHEAVRYVPIVSPASGYIVEKNVVEGSTVEAGARLFRIANLDKVWIEAELYESELPLVKKGMQATVTLPYAGDQKLTGKITFIYPYLDRSTRTGKVRIELPNPEVELKPDMYANVAIDVDLGERVVVPESAVIYAGPRRLVFVDLGGGKLKPKEIHVGVASDDFYEVKDGLEVGERVVTSGNFLIGSESRLKSATGQW